MSTKWGAFRPVMRKRLQVFDIASFFAYAYTLILLGF